jgi:hypothetical protein
MRQRGQRRCRAGTAPRTGTGPPRSLHVLTRQLGKRLQDSLVRQTALQISLNSGDRHPCAGEHRLAAEDAAAPLHMAGLVLTARSYRPTNSRLDGVQVEYLVQDDLVRGLIALPQSVGMLKVDAVTADGEAKPTQRRLVVTVPQMLDDPSDLARRAAGIDQCARDQQLDEVFEGVQPNRVALAELAFDARPDEPARIPRPQPARREARQLGGVALTDRDLVLDDVDHCVLSPPDAPIIAQPWRDGPDAVCDDPASPDRPMRTGQRRIALTSRKYKGGRSVRRATWVRDCTGVAAAG